MIGHVCSNVHVEVRGHLLRNQFSLSTMDSGAYTQATGTAQQVFLCTWPISSAQDFYNIIPNQATVPMSIYICIYHNMLLKNKCLTVKSKQNGWRIGLEENEWNLQTWPKHFQTTVPDLQRFPVLWNSSSPFCWVIACSSTLWFHHESATLLAPMSIKWISMSPRTHYSVFPDVFHLDFCPCRLPTIKSLRKSYNSLFSASQNCSFFPQEELKKHFSLLISKYLDMII